MPHLFAPPAQIAIPVIGRYADFPVRRVYCVGRNYAAHAIEMGGVPERSEPFFFSKPADAVVPLPERLAWPQATRELHHEVELVVALAGGGRDLSPQAAARCVYGLAVGVDLTRRDLQAQAKAERRPWTTAKGFDDSAPVSALRSMDAASLPPSARIQLSVDGDVRQNGRVGDMIWPVPELLARLSHYFRLASGDLVFTGTPEGVGAVEPGQNILASIEAVGELDFRIG